jgi:hypothetical protein
MGVTEKRGVHIFVMYGRTFLVLLAMLMSGLTSFAGSTILFDFEDGTEGLENESARPVPARISNTEARHGQQSLAFTHSFSKSFSCLQCRVKEGFPRDLSTNSFRSFSAWIYIPKGKPNWDMKMFVRYGENWTWAEGPTKKGLEPGWQKVEISYDRIPDLSNIQDIGVQVFNFREPIEATICIDQVEMITQELGAAPDSK